MSNSLLVEKEEGVVTFTLNRPQSKNAVDLELCREFMLEAMALHDDPDVRAVLIRGAGGTFCSGGDLKAFGSQKGALPAYVREMATYYHGVVSRLAHLDAPVIAAVDGAAAGAGLSLACACDIVLAAHSARFTLAGLSIDGGCARRDPGIYR